MSDETPGVRGLVGPNAVLQTADALRAQGGEALARRVFEAASLAHLLDRPPDAMIDQAVAARLHRAVAETLSAKEAEALARDAGARTADYVIANRIPRPARLALRLAPAPLAQRMLLAAIAKHAWTFAGSGRFEAKPGNPARLTIAANPLATPSCPWHRAVFERLFQAFVWEDPAVSETACCARGDAACEFEAGERSRCATLPRAFFFFS